MKKENLLKLLATYGKAWETQDSDLICDIFTEDAIYNAPDSPPCIGRKGIRDYWKEQIVKNEKDIHFNLLNVWIDGDTMIAEWDATFTLTQKHKKVSMTEIAIITIREGLISSLREYYKATVSALSNIP